MTKIRPLVGSVQINAQGELFRNQPDGCHSEAIGATLGELDWHAEEDFVKHLTRTDLYLMHETLSREALNLMRTKNADYAAAEDPFKNFRRHGLLGIVVRLSDKLARLENYVKTGRLVVKDESVRDTVLDLINYSVLFAGLALEEKNAARAAGSGGPNLASVSVPPRT
jgi:hypothetical protein